MLKLPHTDTIFRYILHHFDEFGLQPMCACGLLITRLVVISLSQLSVVNQSVLTRLLVSCSVGLSRVDLHPHAKSFYSTISFCSRHTTRVSGLHFKWLCPFKWRGEKERGVSVTHGLAAVFLSRCQWELLALDIRRDCEVVSEIQ